MTVYIHVAPKAIVDNYADGGKRPCVIVRKAGQVIRAHEVRIKAPDGTVIATVRQLLGKEPNTDKGNTSGARCWIETEHEVELIELE